MADVNISKFRATVNRAGSSPAAPGFVVSEGQDPVNPSGTNNFVPYSGAIGNVDLGEFGLDTGFINLDTTPTNTPTTQGTIYWDDSKSTASLIMNGTIQHIGQDTFFYVKNSTGSSIPKGTAVRFAGTDGGSGHLLITPFLANGSVPSTYFMGVTAEVIANGAFGQVMHFGELEGINTSAYTAGSLLYASTTVAGGFQTTVPVAPNNIVLIAATINSKNNGAILVRPTYGSNINTDEGVKITSPATGQLLQLQAGGLWENKTLAQIIGGTSSQFVKGDASLDSTIYVNGSGTTNYIPKFTGATTLGNSNIQDSGSLVSVGVAANFGADITLTAANPFVYGGTSVGSLGLSNIGGQTYIRLFGASHSTTPNVTQFVNGSSTSLTIAASGAATFSSSINALKGDFGTPFTSTNVLQAIAPSATNSDMFQVGMVGVSNGLTLKRVSSAFIMDWDGSAIFNGTLKTSSPTGSTAQPFKVGSVTTTTDSFFGTVLKMEINGTVYNIMIAEPPL